VVVSVHLVVLRQRGRHPHHVGDDHRIDGDVGWSEPRVVDDDLRSR
jgi:hypothetical protein